MKCPHCAQGFFPKNKMYFLEEDVEGPWALEQFECPSCRKFSFYLSSGNGIQRNNYQGVYVAINNLGEPDLNFRIRVWPKGSSKPPIPLDVPKDYSQDYEEACIVINDSPKASAALSRRSLQFLLREKVKVKNSDLSNEIQELLDRNELPSYIATEIDAVRNIGNFAAHPNKSKSTGEIADVESGEAEWNLNVLESLFDFYFVLPSKSNLRKEQLNNKLEDLGKPPIK